MSHQKLRALCEGAVMLALGTALGFLKLFELPQGGSVCIGMLPLLLFCFRWGSAYSFPICFAYGLLQLLLDGAYAWGPTSMLLDYILAFGVLGVAGFFAHRRGGIWLGTVTACLCRFVMHFISGITIYRIYAPTVLFDTVLTNPYLYSAVYNGSFILLDMLFCLAFFAALRKPLVKFL